MAIPYRWRLHKQKQTFSYTGSSFRAAAWRRKNVRYLSKIPRESTLENTVAASVTMVTDDDYWNPYSVSYNMSSKGNSPVI